MGKRHVKKHLHSLRQCSWQSRAASEPGSPNKAARVNTGQALNQVALVCPVQTDSSLTTPRQAWLFCHMDQSRRASCSRKIFHNLPPGSSCYPTLYLCCKPVRAKNAVVISASLLPLTACWHIETPAFGQNLFCVISSAVLQCPALVTAEVVSRKHCESPPDT